jgi:hypothetical protein
VPIDHDTAETVVRFVALTKALGRIQAIYRRCNKGGVLSLYPYKTPSLDVPAEVQKAIELYDSRNRTGRRIVGPSASGTVLLYLADDLSADDALLAVAPSQESIVAELDTSGGQPRRVTTTTTQSNDIRVEATWIPLVYSPRLLEDLPTAKIAGAWRPELGALLVLMRMAALLSFEPGRNNGFWPTLLRTGYVCGRLDTFEVNYARTAEAMSPQLDQLAGIKVVQASEALDMFRRLGQNQTWPPVAGPPIRISSETIYIDLASCTLWVERLMEFAPGGGGALPNVRATHFEQAIQRIVDRTLWAPGPKTRAYVRRKLKVSGRVLTDMDSIGELDGSLLMISAKSYPYTIEYQRGDHKAVRSVEAKLVDDVEDWWNKVRFLSSTPKGDNYDFAMCQRFIPIVVTPFAPYVVDPRLTQEVASGLRAVSSVAELDAWLARGETRLADL